MISVVIICEHKEERMLIYNLLSSQADFQIVFVGSDGYDALKSAADLQPDLYIMDMWISGIEATQLAPMIKRKSPSSVLIALSSRDDEKYAISAIQAGISGYLLKQVDMRILANSARIAFYGGCYISTPIVSRIFNSAYRTSVPFGDFYNGQTRKFTVFPGFSPTERQIIAGIAQGYSDEEIAENLHIKPGTVRNCMSAVKRKTGLKNRCQIVIQAFLGGLIHLPFSDKNEAYRLCVSENCSTICHDTLKTGQRSDPAGVFPCP